MPPRYSYWTIIAGGLPTAFRAADREELLPTFTRLRQKQPDAEMKWFARGRLWESPAEARAELEQRRARVDERRSGRPRATDRPGAGDRRGRDWRPGGDHRDPRQKFKDAKKARNQRWRDERFARKHGGDRPPRESWVSGGPKTDSATRHGAQARDRKPGWQRGEHAPRGDRKQDGRPGGDRKHASAPGERPPRVDRNAEWTPRDRPPDGGGKPDWRPRDRGPHADRSRPRNTRGFGKPERRWGSGQDAGARAKPEWSAGRGPLPPKRRGHQAHEGNPVAPRGAWTTPREGGRPLERRDFARNQGTEEPKAPPRPRGPNREPRPSESPEPTPPPRPSEPTIPPPTPERGRAPSSTQRPWRPANQGPSRRSKGPRGGGKRS
jgi:hypothetical protein